MSHISGRTTAEYGSPYRHQTLAGATLVFYPQPKVSSEFSRFGWRELGELPSGEIARAAVAEDGTYEADLGDFQGGTLLVALEVEKFAYAPETGKTARGLLGTGVAREGDDGATMDIALAAPSYCELLASLDLWLVAGRATDCAKQPIPAANAEVTAYDRDLTQDDELGTDTTDGAGNFEIFFPGSTFRQIPSLPPPFDSILPHELIGGPDVYFKVEAGGGTLLDEDPSLGRTAGRENRTHCTWVELCVEPPDWSPQDITLWNRIGFHAVPNAPGAAGLNDFDADGFVDSGKLAFYKGIDFNGQLSQTYLGQPVSYRFLFAEWSDMTTAPALPADYQPLTSTHITSHPYGAIRVVTGPNPLTDFTLNYLPPTPDAQGWIDVSQHPDFVRPENRLIRLDTTTLVPAISKSGPSTAGAGDPVPAANQDRPRKFSFMLQVRAGAVTYQHPVPVPIHINNSAVYARFDLQQLTSNSCNPIAPQPSGDIEVNPMYTVGHPYLSSFSVTLQRQGGTLATLRSDNHGSHSPLWTGLTGEHDTFLATYGDVQPCSYRCWLSFGRRLTNGYGGPGDGPLLRTFCTS